MTERQAASIATLLNNRNQLQDPYTGIKVLTSKENYLFQEKEGEIIACVEAKKVQWYQWEICHVSVASNMERKGYASKILKLAEQRAKEGGARILQCTIRANNGASQALFLSQGYNKTNSFFNKVSGNWVNVYQKNISVSP